MKDIIPMELYKDFEKYLSRNLLSNNWESFERFMLEETKPTLTEDERVILRNINKNFRYISRDDSDLFISIKRHNEEEEFFYAFNHLFQFIKERRRILY